MSKNIYFSLNDDFKTIINNTLLDNRILGIKQISTGWTNIVFEVTTDSGNYFFRFPRDNFWSKTIVKDYEFSKYIKGKTDYNTVELQLFYAEDRPFSVHKKIEGISLAEKMNNLTPYEIHNISYDISNFMYQLHTIPYTQDKIFSVNNIGLKLVDFLDELLDSHISNKNKVFWKYDEFKEKKQNILVHGDLNSSNILLDNNNNLTAIIDFGFGGFGNPYFDISRIIGRCPESFRDEIINSYEEISQSKIDNDILNTEVDIWEKIDKSYIEYMRSIGIYQ